MHTEEKREARCLLQGEGKKMSLLSSVVSLYHCAACCIVSASSDTNLSSFQTLWLHLMETNHYNTQAEEAAAAEEEEAAVEEEAEVEEEAPAEE